jgi:hypothetical protein
MNALQSCMGKVKRDKKEWQGSSDDFRDRVMESGWPYYVVSCPCGCLRLGCLASELPHNAPIVVTPVVNRSAEWRSRWEVIH